MTQLHREFLRAGSDVLQSFTFNAVDSKLSERGCKSTGAEINRAGVELVKRVAAEGDALTAGSLSRKGITCRDDGIINTWTTAVNNMIAYSTCHLCTIKK